MHQRGGNAFVGAFLTKNDNRGWSDSELTEENRGYFIAWITHSTTISPSSDLSDDTRSQILSFLRYLNKEESLSTRDHKAWVDPICKYFISWMLRNESYTYHLQSFIAEVAEIISTEIELDVTSSGSLSLLQYFVQNGGLESLAWLANQFDLEQAGRDDINMIKHAYGTISYLIGLQRYGINEGKWLYLTASLNAVNNGGKFVIA